MTVPQTADPRPALLALSDAPEGSPIRRALLAATAAMGFSPEVARAGLGAELDAWRDRAALARLVDGAASKGHRPRRVLVLAARTLPVSTLREALHARLLGAEVSLKPATGAEAVAAAIAAADPRVSAAPFDAHDGAALSAALARHDAVIVLGSDATVRSVTDTAAALGPDAPAVVGYGHRVSAAWFDGAADDRALRGLAEDLLAWDQAGCMSPQVVWTSQPATELAERLADAVRVLEATRPMTPAPAAARERLAATSLAEMLGARVPTETAELLALPSAGAFRASPGRRVLWILPLDHPDAAPALARLSGVWSTIATLDGAPGALAAVPGLDLRATRICAPGAMQRPPIDALRDGIHPLKALESAPPTLKKS